MTRTDFSRIDRAIEGYQAAVHALSLHTGPTATLPVAQWVYLNQSMGLLSQAAEDTQERMMEEDDTD